MDSKQRSENGNVIKREIVIGNTRIHLISVFTGQTKMDDALINIVMKRLEGRDLTKADLHKNISKPFL